jgi:hypothetical protein
MNVRCDFQLALNEENRALSGPFAVEIVLARESATKHNARGLGQNLDVFTERLPNQFQDRRFPGARPPGENNTAAFMGFSALARDHAASYHERTSRLGLWKC